MSAQRPSGSRFLIFGLNLYSHIHCVMTKHSQLDNLHIDFVQLPVYIQSLTTASEIQLFGSVVRALVLYRYDRIFIPSHGAGLFTAVLYRCRHFKCSKNYICKQYKALWSLRLLVGSSEPKLVICVPFLGIHTRSMISALVLTKS